MNEKIRKRIVFAMLPLAIIWAAYKFSGPKPEIEIERPETIKPITTQQMAAEGNAVRHPDMSTKPWGLDPFRTVRTVPSKKDLAWTVTGILYNSVTPLAYVNREMVREGDTIDDAVVVKIDKRSVTLEYRGDQFTIAVSKG